MHARLFLTLPLALLIWPMAANGQKPEEPPTAEHEDAMRRARVWFEPAIPIELARLGENPPGADSFSLDQKVACSFRPGYMGGSTPKFDCELPDGDQVKVKYGRGNAEIYAEVAGSRLLNALGFPADRMYVVKRVRCYGCDEDPYKGMQCLNEGGEFDACFGDLDYTAYHDFDFAVIERSVKGRRIECGHPVAIVQDLGATFGPSKIDLDNWTETPIWADAATCMVSMRAWPRGGAGFPDARISEAGRQFLATRLIKLSQRQIRELFDGARITRYPHENPDAKDADQWVRAFQEKVSAIADRPPCPNAP